jgi:hypothetical protein
MNAKGLQGFDRNMAGADFLPWRLKRGYQIPFLMPKIHNKFTMMTNVNAFQRAFFTLICPSTA